MGPRIVVPLLFASAEAYHGKAAAFLGRAAPRAGAAPTSLDEALGDKGTWAECWERLKGGKLNTLVNDLGNRIGPKKLSKMLGQLGGSDMKELLRKLDPAEIKKMVEKMPPKALTDMVEKLGQDGVSKMIKELVDSGTPGGDLDKDLAKISEALGDQSVWQSEQKMYEGFLSNMRKILSSVSPTAAAHMLTSAGADMGALLGTLDPTVLSSVVGGMGAKELGPMVGNLKVEGLEDVVVNLGAADLTKMVTTIHPDDLTNMVSKLKDSEALEKLKTSLEGMPDLAKKLGESLKQIAVSETITSSRDENKKIEVEVEKEGTVTAQPLKALRRLARGLRRSLRAIE